MIDVTKESKVFEVIVEYVGEILEDEHVGFKNHSKFYSGLPVKNLNRMAYPVANLEKISRNLLAWNPLLRSSLKPSDCRSLKRKNTYLPTVEDELAPRYSKEPGADTKSGLKLLVLNKNFSYGLYRKLAVLLGLNLLLVGGYFAHALYRVNTAVVLANYMELYNLVVETWNVHATMHSALTSYMLWNDTSSMMNQKASDVYLNMSSQFKNRLIPKYESFFKANLGDFQSYYNQFSEAGHICELIQPFTRAKYKNCGQGLASFIDESIPIFLKSMISILDETFHSFRLGGRTQQALRQVFSDQKYRVYQAYFTNGRLMSDFYYLILRPLGLQIEAIVYANKADVSSGLSDPNDNTDLRLYVYLFLPLFIVYLILLLFCFILPVYRIFVVYWYAIRLIPLNLIDKNPWLMHHFRRVQAGTHDFVQF
jgi:hypothetical protein